MNKVGRKSGGTIFLEIQMIPILILEELLFLHFCLGYNRSHGLLKIASPIKFLGSDDISS